MQKVCFIKILYVYTGNIAAMAAGFQSIAACTRASALKTGHWRYLCVCLCTVLPGRAFQLQLGFTVTKGMKLVFKKLVSLGYPIVKCVYHSHSSPDGTSLWRMAPSIPKSRYSVAECDKKSRYIGYIGWLDKMDQTWFLDQTSVWDLICINFSSEDKHSVLSSRSVQNSVWSKSSLRPNLMWTVRSNRQL